MKNRKRVLCLAGLLVLALGVPGPERIFADPCGMVPPIYTGPGVPIVRTGLQQTYVFYKDGVETFVIKPGFEGRVEDFGMLIPFPTPPELRKVPDNIFEHIDNAIDPPEVVLNLNPIEPASDELFAANGAMDDMQLRFRADESSVVVLKEEAVGMYEVAVLQAGSSAALKRWMDDNGYQYPKGMDKTAEEYVQDKWCFVAVKTKVGRAAGAEPQAGQRKVDTKKPENSVFNGAVQGMGFRFKSDRLVVPMRLSASNEGELRNIVYLLADGPKRIRNIPEEYVVRQVTGQQLLDNVTLPLPLRILGGTEKDITDAHRADLKIRRAPGPKNGSAKNLFATDLLAISSGKMSLQVEEDEKELLRINEHFGLRGPEIDAAVAATQDKALEEISATAIQDLKEMTLTLVDGDFPRQVIANQNLGFADYRIPAARNKASIYDSKTHGTPGQTWYGDQGIRVSQVDFDVWVAQKQNRRNRNWMLLFGCLSVGVVLTLLRRRSQSISEVQGA